MSDPADQSSQGAASGVAVTRRRVSLRELVQNATAAQQAGRVDEAIGLYLQALAARPSLEGPYNNVGACYYVKGRYDAAAAWYRAALARGDETARSNLGEAYRKLGRLAEAEALQREVLARDPTNVSARFSLAETLREGGHLDEALAELDETVRRGPNFDSATWNRALLLLQLGRYAEGFVGYEERFKRMKNGPRKLDVPRWQGEPLEGRTILLYDEQGFGDSLQFARFIKAVAARGGRVVFECRPPLARLMASLEGVATVVPRGEPLPPFDVAAPLLSLPLILGTTLETVLAPARYLASRAEAGGVFDRVLPLDAKVIKVGIAWAGRAIHANDAIRSAGLGAFAPLIGLPNVSLYSLQIGPRAADLDAFGFRGLITDLAPLLKDFADTAAAMERLDLVVSIDSAVAHLAGALGRPVWVALPFVAEWRWLTKRSDSPWYPSMRLFRQPRFGDWDSVFRHIATALEVRDGLAVPAGA